MKNTTSRVGAQRRPNRPGASRLWTTTDLERMPVTSSRRVPGPIRSRDGSAVVRVLGEALDATWWQGAQWAVTAYGIERRDGKYNIAAARLLENDPTSYSWIRHLAEKGWCDLEDFTTALLVGCAMHGATISPEVRAALIRHLEKGRGVQHDG